MQQTQFTLRCRRRDRSLAPIGSPCLCFRSTLGQTPKRGINTVKTTAPHGRQNATLEQIEGGLVKSARRQIPIGEWVDPIACENTKQLARDTARAPFSNSFIVLFFFPSRIWFASYIPIVPSYRFEARVACPLKFASPSKPIHTTVSRLFAHQTVCPSLLGVSNEKTICTRTR